MESFTNSSTFRLFKKKAVSPFVEGMAAILDPSGPERMYKYDRTGADADRNAICADWQQVGRDLRASMSEYASRKIA